MRIEMTCRLDVSGGGRSARVGVVEPLEGLLGTLGVDSEVRGYVDGRAGQYSAFSDGFCVTIRRVAQTKPGQIGERLSCAEQVRVAQKLRHSRIAGDALALVHGFTSSRSLRFTNSSASADIPSPPLKPHLNSRRLVS